MVAAYPSFATPDQYAALTGTNPPPDNIQDLLDAASSAIRRYCGWHISPVVTEDVTVDGSGGDIQSLPTLRLLDIISLSEIWNDQLTYIYSLSEIEWSRNGYLRKPSGVWTRRLSGILANIKHGFEAGDTGDLAQMTVTMAARAISSPFGVTTQTVGQVSVRYGSGSSSSGSAGGVTLYPDQAAQLDAYKLFGRP